MAFFNLAGDLIDTVTVRVMMDPHHRDFSRTLRISDDGENWVLIEAEDIASMTEISNCLLEMKISEQFAREHNFEIIDD